VQTLRQRGLLPQVLSLLVLLVQKYKFTCFTGTKVRILTLLLPQTRQPLVLLVQK
jgi:hypothetical protein